jgi:mRNA interferase HigB
VHVISKKRLQEAAQDKTYAEAASELETWHRVAKTADWSRLEDVQKPYPKAEAVHVRSETYTVFNIRRNRFRLIVKMEYVSKTIFIKYVLTHAEYDRNEWKEGLKQEQIDREQREKERSRSK